MLENQVKNQALMASSYNTTPTTAQQMQTQSQIQSQTQNQQSSAMRNLLKPAQSSTEQEGLKCPRCDSTNTKFCYYNNYSLTQPRHFCKTCRRYWTRGGSLRSVPVGGGCRKNTKRAASSPSNTNSSSSASSSSTSSTMLSNNFLKTSSADQPFGLDLTSSAQISPSFSANSIEPDLGLINYMGGFRHPPQVDEPNPLLAPTFFDSFAASNFSTTLQSLQPNALLSPESSLNSLPNSIPNYRTILNSSAAELSLVSQQPVTEIPQIYHPYLNTSLDHHQTHVRNSIAENEAPKGSLEAETATFWNGPSSADFSAITYGFSGINPPSS